MKFHFFSNFNSSSSLTSQFSILSYFFTSYTLYSSSSISFHCIHHFSHFTTFIIDNIYLYLYYFTTFIILYSLYSLYRLYSLCPLYSLYSSFSMYLLIIVSDFYFVLLEKKNGVTLLWRMNRVACAQIAKLGCGSGMCLRNVKTNTIMRHIRSITDAEADILYLQNFKANIHTHTHLYILLEFRKRSSHSVNFSRSGKNGGILLKGKEACA